MKDNKNIFCASNPARLLDALLSFDIGDNDIVFLPSRRAVRSLEKALAEKSGGAILLPKLVALGEEPDDEESTEHREQSTDIVSNTERVIVLAKLLAAMENSNLASVLPVARDLVRMQDYLENEQRTMNVEIDWMSLVDEKYAVHFQKKAEFLNLVSNFLPTLFPNKITESQKRNQGIRDWINVIGDAHHASPNDEQQLTIQDSRIIICGSTGSVPATQDLMTFVASLRNGIIILPGKINQSDISNNPPEITNPYYSEMKFLERIGVHPNKVSVIDVGQSDIDFLNDAFSNNYNLARREYSPGMPSKANKYEPIRIDCARESEEAAVVAEIAAHAQAENKTVLVITPDAAGNQRLKEAFAARGIHSDFSGGISGNATPLGRAILNALDDKIHSTEQIAQSTGDIDNLFEYINSFISTELSESDLPIIEKIADVSKICTDNGIYLNLSDVRAVINDAMSSVQIRPPQTDDAKIRILGTIESRMQTADIVILTGLNEGMFPGIGYENPWLPRRIIDEIGLPPPERKVALMALDFINLSCADNVYWTRSTTAGGTQTTESRFLSRISVRQVRHKAEGIGQSVADVHDQNTNLGNKEPALCLMPYALLSSVRARDNVLLRPLDYSPPRPVPGDRSPVYVTTLEHLFHNPYSFYAKQILKLKVRDDWWAEPDARDFGNIVHKVIEHRAQSTENTECAIIEELDAQAKKILPAGSVLFHFWHKRFVDIAPFIIQMLDETVGGQSEIQLKTQIAGRTVLAYADMVCGNTVYDIKTGKAPTATQMGLAREYKDGRVMVKPTMPQLPLEAYMLAEMRNTNQLSAQAKCETRTPEMKFLQLQRENIEWKIYDGSDAKQMIENTVQAVSELFGRYGKDAEPYDYHDSGDAKYKKYDDLARIKD